MESISTPSTFRFSNLIVFYLLKLFNLSASRLSVVSLITVRSLLFFIWYGAATPVHANHTHLLGVAKVDVTPTFPVILSGYAGRAQTMSQDVTQPLWARALAIGSDSSTSAVLIAVDNCGISAAIRRAVAVDAERLYGLSPQRLTITSTHTHSAPILRDLRGHRFSVSVFDHEAGVIYQNWPPHCLQSPSWSDGD